MSRTKTVSLRVPVEDLEAVVASGAAPADIMREALHREALAWRAKAWAEEARRNLWKLPKGSPTSEQIIREMRDER